MSPLLSTRTLLLLSLSLCLCLSISCLSVSGEKINDCCCEAERVDVGNQDQGLYETLRKLRTFTYFSVFRLDLWSDCPFWRENPQCSRLNCAVCGECKDADVPEPWRIPTTDAVDRTLAGSFKGWGEQDDSLWIVQDQPDHMTYVNVKLNPEGYTGYEGFAAHRIWKALYDENCFSSLPHQDSELLASGVMKPVVRSEEEVRTMCYEQRVFYRLLSGLHASISCHVSNAYPVGNVDPHMDMHADENRAFIGPNATQYQERVGKHPDRKNNLYFAFVFMLRAVNKASATLKQINYATGNATEDAELKGLVHTFLDHPLVSSCSSAASFDETTMFNSPTQSNEGATLRTALKHAFRNISRIMDCVGCEKCKLHGKLQILGLGTALKILFSPPEEKLRLDRNEVMALIVTLAKFSNAVRVMREMDERISDMQIKESLAFAVVTTLFQPKVFAGVVGGLILLILALFVSMCKGKRKIEAKKDQ